MPSIPRVRGRLNDLLYKETDSGMAYPPESFHSSHLFISVSMNSLPSEAVIGLPGGSSAFTPCLAPSPAASGWFAVRLKRVN